ncbi:MAG: SDR family oxidoreductase [Chloroflexi bacterium AL-W]|nr:SDR family oxidoreductase [Chloroflexi bacterium AL-N1]NOK71312.1 SDR family oxidoreductase [Chloroflexi bacterium AL-N10]NOK77687.1 SDR family oxidoreductase [Chloroflexi bacterium AL-N5]NOK84538.1 SDR family oxidoreductase [Chloroflexi bacterium AL-W]NOK92989.1 SDR family oxidoreductase [Chloroflexi bacterium AL-N15]
MGFELNKRVAIITGGANGIGRTTALAFAQAGATVVIWDMNEETGQTILDEITTAGGQAVFASVNVAVQSEVDVAVTAVVEQFGRVDILINNAGILRDAQLIKIKDGSVVGKMSEDDFDAVIGVNLKGVFNCTQAVAPIMIQQSYGRIINASSVVGLYGNFGQTNYVAAKSGVIGMTKVWARELGPRGITVNAIAPGFIETEMISRMPEKVLNMMIEHTPVRRMGKPIDVANAYLFLASDEASFISGTVLSVDGGAVVGT